MGQFWATKSVPTDKHIVIVGAGFGGCFLALELQKAGASFTIIGPSDVFHYNPAAVRAVVLPGWAEQSLLPLKTTFGDHFKRDTVVEVSLDEQTVVLASGERLTYDILVVATGQAGVWPHKVGELSREEAILGYTDTARKVKSSQRVLVIGGGSTGVEVAAEVAAAYPTKEVTLIHGTDRLIGPRLTDNFQAKLKDMLQQLKVNLICGERVKDLSTLPEVGPVTVTTESGKTFCADYIFKCIGSGSRPKPSPAGIKGLEGAVNERGELRVNKYLRLVERHDVYALGDVTDIPEPKLAFLTMAQADVLAKTMINVLNSGQPVSYTPDNAPIELGLVLGPAKGLSQTRGGWLVPSFIMTWLKSRTLFTEKIWKEFGQSQPKLQHVQL